MSLRHHGRRFVVMGLSDGKGIAAATVRQLRKEGAHVACTYWSEKIHDQVQPVAYDLGVDALIPCDVKNLDEILTLPDRLRAVHWWDKGERNIDGIVFAIAKAKAMEQMIDLPMDKLAMVIQETIAVSALPLLHIAKVFEPSLSPFSCLVAYGYMGAELLEPQYRGPIAAAKVLQDMFVKQIAVAWGPKQLRCNNISPGVIRTTAAEHIDGFDDLNETSIRLSPMHMQIEAEDAARATSFLLSHVESRVTTGITMPINGGRHLVHQG
jgi:enoyl-[acyl-carrier protein] reductase I